MGESSGDTELSLVHLVSQQKTLSWLWSHGCAKSCLDSRVRFGDKKTDTLRQPSTPVVLLQWETKDSVFESDSHADSSAGDNSTIPSQTLHFLASRLTHLKCQLDYVLPLGV